LIANIAIPEIAIEACLPANRNGFAVDDRGPIIDSICFDLLAITPACPWSRKDYFPLTAQADLEYSTNSITDRAGNIYAAGADKTPSRSSPDIPFQRISFLCKSASGLHHFAADAAAEAGHWRGMAFDSKARRHKYRPDW
jgi:hypothetical protein